MAALLAAYGIGFIHVLDDVARQAFAIFEPAVRNRGDVGVLSRALTLVPDRIALPFVLVFEVVVTIAYLSDPVERAHLLSRQFLEQAAIMVTNWASGVITAVLLLHVVRQLVAVTRLHRLADVDLFDAGPAHAFARLTATAATGILVLALVVVADPAAASNTILFAVQVGGIILLAVAAFGLPLRGMHGKLVAEQAALLRSVNERIKLVISRIHASVDADELERSGHLQETLTSLIAERELIGKLSTWPWSTGTFRGFASALLLPIAIWAITRALEQVI